MLWLWCRLVAAVLIQPLAQELPYAMGIAIKRKKKKERNLWALTDHHGTLSLHIPKNPYVRFPNPLYQEKKTQNLLW